MLFITIILILIALIVFIFFNPLIKIKLIGKDETIEVFTKYKDKGVKIEGTKNKVKITNKDYILTDHALDNVQECCLVLTNHKNNKNNKKKSKSNRYKKTRNNSSRK